MIINISFATKNPSALAQEASAAELPTPYVVTGPSAGLFLVDFTVANKEFANRAIDLADCHHKLAQL